MAMSMSAEEQREISYQRKKENLLQQFTAHSAHSAQAGPIRLKKKTSNLFRHRQKQNANWLDLSGFNQVIGIDRENLTAEVEGLITYEDLVTETLKFNCLPAVVPELKSITVGGAIAGLGAESSSFKYGWVHETAVELDVLLSQGQVITCTPHNDYRDLFYAIPSSYGTLGYVLKAKISLIPVKPFVKITRLQFSDVNAYFAKLAELASHPESELAFIDGVAMDGDLFINLGHFVNEAPYISDYKYMHIYYRSIPQKKIDYLTTADYIWRWDPDWFWCSKYFLMQNYFFRFLLGKWLLKSTMYWRMMHFVNTNKIAKSLSGWIGNKTETIIQDLQIPLEHAVDFYHFFKNEIHINPILICPLQMNANFDKFLFCQMHKDKLYINFGAYGNFIPSDAEKGFFNKRIEEKVSQCQGNKWLYSNVFYSEEQFWSLYDKSAYLAVKKKYDPVGLLNDIYSKCSEKMV